MTILPLSFVGPHQEKNSMGSVRLALSRLAGWPATSRNHCSRHTRTVFFSHNNQSEQYFSVLPNRPLLAQAWLEASDFGCLRPGLLANLNSPYVFERRPGWQLPARQNILTIVIGIGGRLVQWPCVSQTKIPRLFSFWPGLM